MQVLRCFAGYLDVMRALHRAYLLEPAGSHGVWGLDDYHCLPFLWGAAQLAEHATIPPDAVNDEEVSVSVAMAAFSGQLFSNVFSVFFFPSSAAVKWIVCQAFSLRRSCELSSNNLCVI
jgi:Phosphotyrosyl phosphate activator (PTPA) protein